MPGIRKIRKPTKLPFKKRKNVNSRNPEPVFEFFQKCVFRLESDKPTNFGAVLQKYRRRYARNTKFGRRLGMIIDINLAHFHLPFVILRERIKNRCHHPARSAPVGVHIYNRKPLCGFCFEILVCKLESHGHSLDLAAWIVKHEERRII